MEETLTVMISTVQDAPAIPVVIPRRIGTVKLGELLGAGTGGVVYSGYDEVLERRVAVKLIQAPVDAEASARGIGLVDGVRTAANIKHENVITVHAVDEVNGVYVIVMELVQGISLRELLKRTGAMEVGLAAFVMRSVGAGVEALHEAQVIHRDLKPANVLFDREGRAHVCDFGLACAFSHKSHVTGTEKIAGSPLYMAPETFEGIISPQSDVYALGAMFFELLCQRPPFSAQTITELKSCHQSAPVPIEWLETFGLPEQTEDVIERAMHKQRIMRYKTAGHFVRALEHIETGDVRDHALRQRVAGIVAGVGADPESDHPGEPSEAPAKTMFDLVTRRAQRKRDSKGNGSSRFE